MATETMKLDELISRDYQHGFFTILETDTVPSGLNEAVIRLISAKKEEPEFMLDWRLKAYRHWLTMSEPDWSTIRHPPIDYQGISFYSAPKSRQDGPQSLADVDPELLRTYEKLGVPLQEREMLAGVAVDAVFDSVSVATTFKAKLSVGPLRRNSTDGFGSGVRIREVRKPTFGAICRQRPLPDC
jgi:Fe-S cluster assembly protein SufB